MSESIDQDDLDLDYTRAMRIRLVESMVEGDKLPTETKDRMVMLTALADIDRTVLSKKRIKVEKDVGDNQKQAASMLAEIFRDSRVGQLGRGKRDSVPVMSDDVPSAPLLEGELTTGSTGDSYEQFASRTGVEM